MKDAIRALIDEMRSDPDRNETLLEYARELESALAAESTPNGPTCSVCKRTSARDGEASHEGKCGRRLAEQYGQRSGFDHDECARLAPESPDPERQARERLGVWLASEPLRGWFYSGSPEHGFRVHVRRDWAEESPVDICGSGGTLGEAMVREAKAST